MVIITIAILGFTLIGNLGLLLLLSRTVNSRTQFIFLAYVASITAWTIAIFSNLWLESALVERLIFFFAAIILTAQFWFAKLFPEDKMPAAWSEYWSLSVGVAFAFVSLWPGATFSSFTLTPEGYTILNNGYLSTLYSIFAISFVCAPIFMLAGKYRQYQTQQRIRTQLRLLIWGFTGFALINLFTNSVLPVFFNVYLFNAIGPVFSLILAVLIAYGIGQLQLFNIKAAVQRSVQYSLFLAIIIATYLLVLILLQHFLSLTTLLAAPVSAGLVLVIGLYTIPPFERWFRKNTDRLFFKGDYNSPEELETISRIVHDTINFDVLTQRLADTLARILRAERVVILTSQAAATAEAPLDDDLLTNEGYKMRVPIRHKQTVIGYITVHEKRSGDRYQQQDVQLLKILAHHAGTALERALLFKQVEDYANELERKVADRTSELEALQSYQKHLLDEIAHGLQTPLTVITNELSALTHTHSTEQLRAFNTSIAALRHFVQNLLRLSQLDAPQSVWLQERFNVSAVIAEVFEYSEISLRQPNITFSSKITPDLFMVGDRKKLEELLQIFLSNAVKYRDPQRLQHITVTLTADTACLLLQIHDTGLGIPQDQQPHIFKRFYRIRNEDRNEIGGSGLGLAIADIIIRKHQGTIVVKSVPRSYTLFTIELPWSTDLQ